MPALALQLDPGQWRFVVYMACIVAAIAGGYALSRLGWVRRDWAKPIMSFAIIACDAPIAWLSLWHLRIDPSVWKVPVAGGIAAMAVSLIGLGLGKRLGLGRADQALFGLQGGMGNVGYTLGGSICFALFGLQGLALEQMFCLMWPFYAFLFCFPLARHCGHQAAVEAGRAEPVERPPGWWRTAGGVAWRSLTDLRSLPLYLAVLGLGLNLGGRAPWPAIRRWHVIDTLMILGIFLQFGGVGMTVRVRKLWAHARLALATAGMKLVVHPLLMAATAAALGLSGLGLDVVLVLALMPTALYSVLMANLFGLNRDLANATFLLTHALVLAIVVPALAVVYG